MGFASRFFNLPHWHSIIYPLKRYLYALLAFLLVVWIGLILTRSSILAWICYEILFAMIAAWASGVVLSDSMIEQVLVTGVSLRWLWFLRSIIIILPLIITILGSGRVLSLDWYKLMFACSVVSIAWTSAAWIARLMRRTILGIMFLSILIAIQIGAAEAWLIKYKSFGLTHWEVWFKENYGRFLYLPLDVQWIFKPTSQFRATSLRYFVIGSVIFFIWTLWLYGKEEIFTKPVDD